MEDKKTSEVLGGVYDSVKGGFEDARMNIEIIMETLKGKGLDTTHEYKSLQDIIDGLTQMEANIKIDKFADCGKCDNESCKHHPQYDEDMVVPSDVVGQIGKIIDGIEKNITPLQLASSMQRIVSNVGIDGKAVTKILMVEYGV